MKNLYFYRTRLTESMNFEKKRFFFGLFKNGKMLSKVTYFQNSTKLSFIEPANITLI